MGLSNTTSDVSWPRRSSLDGEPGHNSSTRNLRARNLDGGGGELGRGEEPRSRLVVRARPAGSSARVTPRLPDKEQRLGPARDGARDLQFGQEGRGTPAAAS